MAEKLSAVKGMNDIAPPVSAHWEWLEDTLRSLMRRYGYRRDFALGSVAGSACLGMLIPPSVLMIVWCVLTELSIGKLFLAGVIPGLLTAGGMVLYVVIAAKLRPELVGETGLRLLGPELLAPLVGRLELGLFRPCHPDVEGFGQIFSGSGLLVDHVIPRGAQL